MSDKKYVDVQVIIQARMGSSRLPGKILSHFVGGHTVLEWIIERARQSRFVQRVIVATTTNPKDDETILACERRGCDYVRGSEEDVLARFVHAAKEFPCKTIVHITADNPLFDLSEMDRQIETFLEEDLDYANNHPTGLPLGTGTEVFKTSALLEMAEKTQDPYDHEHVTPYFYNHAEMYKQKNLSPLQVNPLAPSARLTLDTPQDLEFLKELTNQMEITAPEKQPTTFEILSFLERHPKLLEINKDVIQKTFPVKNS